VIGPGGFGAAGTAATPAKTVVTSSVGPNQMITVGPDQVITLKRCCDGGDPRHRGCSAPPRHVESDGPFNEVVPHGRNNEGRREASGVQVESVQTRSLNV
jgi:hypothetical protein